MNSAARLIAQVGAPLGPLVAGLLLRAFSTRLTCLVITASYAAIALVGDREPVDPEGAAS